MGRVALIYLILFELRVLRLIYNTIKIIPNLFPTPLKIYSEVSSTLPISIVTCKDVDFIYPKTKKFAKILCCNLDLETFVLVEFDFYIYCQNIPKNTTAIYSMLNNNECDHNTNSN